jgi:Holliday junction resolvase
MGWAKRVDGPHAEIVKALRRCGCSVLDLSRVGEGAPDLLVGRAGHSMLLEVKSARGQVRASQRAFTAAWRGCPVLVVRSVDEALKLIGVAV